MNILLINSNPIVSRLLVLCTRDKHMVLDEISDIDAIQHENYDVIFIDEGLYGGEVLGIANILTKGKKIFLSSTDTNLNNFDITIKKPFLPSQIIKILEAIEETNNVSKELEISAPSIFPLSSDKCELPKVQELESDVETELFTDTQVLDTEELEKIKALLSMDEEMEIPDESLSDDEIEQLKVKIIKEQLIADGLEIVEEEEIIEKLSEKEDDIVLFPSKNKVKKKSKKKKKKSIAFTQDELERIEDAVQVAIATLKRKQMKKLLKGKEIEVTIKLEDGI